MKTFWLSLMVVITWSVDAPAQTVRKTNAPAPIKSAPLPPPDKKAVSAFQGRKFATTGEVPYEVETFLLAKQAGQYMIETRVSEVKKVDGQETRRLVGSPRLVTSLGQLASLTQGGDKPEGESVLLSVQMPPDAQGEAAFKVTVKQGDKVTGEAEFKLPVANRGATPVGIK